MEVESDILNDVIGCEDYHKRVQQFGDRAWMAEGKKVDVVYWDGGNGWCDIMLVIPHGNKEFLEMGEKFHDALDKKIEKCYDENWYRID